MLHMSLPGKSIFVYADWDVAKTDERLLSNEYTSRYVEQHSYQKHQDYSILEQISTLMYPDMRNIAVEHTISDFTPFLSSSSPLALLLLLFSCNGPGEQSSRLYPSVAPFFVALLVHGSCQLLKLPRSRFHPIKHLLLGALTASYISWAWRFSAWPLKMVRIVLGIVRTQGAFERSVSSRC